MAAARQNSSPENFHEWRKRVKDHWYHVRLLERIWSPMMTAYAGVLKDLQAWLGDDHNLTVLREMIEDSQSKRTHARDLLRLIEQHQAGLREQALAVGKRIYAPKPKQLVSAMESLWNVSPEPETILEAL